MTTSTKGRSRSIARWGEHDHTVLVLQGGGALGAYQAGAYAALSEGGIEPDWIAGVSIGAINAALIAGNLPERRVRATLSSAKANAAQLAQNFSDVSC